MCEFSTESQMKWFSIFVNRGQVAAVLVSDDTRGKIYLRDEKDTERIFFQAAKALAVEFPEDFKKMRQLIEQDASFWRLSEQALLELISDLNKLFC